MFDIGWTELLVIGAVALIVVGPKDLPGLLRTVGQVVGKARRMAREFQSSMEDAARQADVSELRDVQKSMADWNRKIGGDGPRKYAERLMGEGGEAKPSTAAKPAGTPAPSAGGEPTAAPAPAASPAAASTEAASPDDAAPAPRPSGPAA